VGAVGPLKTAQPHGLSSLVPSLLLLYGHESYDGVSWTLSYELYFYLLFAVILVSRRLIVIPVLVFGLTFLARQWDLPLSGGGEFLLNELVLEFALGMLAAQLYMWREKWPHLPYRSLLVLGITYGYLASKFDFNRVSGYGPAAFLLVWTTAVLESKKQLAKSRLLTMLGHLGDASYMIYLIHLPILNILVKQLPRLHAPEAVVILLAVAVAASICVVGIIAHDRVEKPMLAWLRRRVQKSNKSVHIAGPGA